MTILIVDDNEKNLYVLQAMLAGSGYQVDSAANGAEALAKARQKPPDLIVSDILMPVLDGFALCREWKQDERLRPIPFVFYTATYTDARDRELALSLGAERFLVKPEEPEVFIRTIREVIQQVLTPPAAPAESAAGAPPRCPVEALPEEDAVCLKQYNEALIRKLEVKMRQLEQTNRELERDIAARQEAEQAQLFLLAMFDAMPDFVGFADARDTHILYINPAGRKMIGLGAQEDVTRLKIANVHPEWTNKLFHDEVIPTAIRDGVWEGECAFLNRDGCEIPVLMLLLSHRSPTGEIERFSTISRDITERKRAEAEREKLEAQNRQLQKSESLSRMASAIAHHFNNKLHAVMMNLELLKTALPLTAGSVEFLTEAMHAARKAAEMSGLMLTYLGKTIAKREPLDLAKTCLRHLSLLRAALPQNVVLETDLPDPGPAISGSANQILQVLTNLVNNAWEASGDGRGGIRLTVQTVAAADIPAAHRFPIDWQPRDPAYACLEVADTGGGIPNQDIEKIFDPFFTTKFIGRGLGLAVILGIVRAHRGVITVASKPGHGSVFRVFFPVLGEAAPRMAAPVAPAPEFKGEGALMLVEDDPSLRRVVMLALTQLGFTVLEAKDGLEAVELFQQHQAEIRCVLCDLTMPRMNGWETLTALRKMAHGLPFILSSGYNEAHAMEGAHTELPQAFLSKPYVKDALINALRQALAHRQK